MQNRYKVIHKTLSVCYVHCKLVDLYFSDYVLMYTVKLISYCKYMDQKDVISILNSILVP